MQFKTHGISLPASYQILQVNGQLMGSGTIRSEQEQLNLSHLPDGVYFLRIGTLNRAAIILIAR